MERDYKVTCDRSGMVFLRSECRMTWDNKLVAKKYWEPRHPQDIIRPKTDDQTIPIAKPGPNDPDRGTPMYYDLMLTYDTVCTYVGVAGFDVSMAI
jgi:hypothetical protein